MSKPEPKQKYPKGYSVKLFGTQHGLEYLQPTLKALSHVDKDTILGLEIVSWRVALFNSIRRSEDPARELRRIALIDVGIRHPTPEMFSCSEKELVKYVHPTKRWLIESFLFFYHIFDFALSRGARIVPLISDEAHEKRLEGTRLAAAYRRRGEFNKAQDIVDKAIDIFIDSEIANRIEKHRVTDAVMHATHVRGVSYELKNRGISLRKSWFPKAKNPEHALGLKKKLARLERLRPFSQQRRGTQRKNLLKNRKRRR